MGHVQWIINESKECIFYLFKLKRIVFLFNFSMVETKRAFHNAMYHKTGCIKECISAVLAIEQMYLSIRGIISDTILGYNEKILEGGCSLTISLAQMDFLYEGPLRKLSKMCVLEHKSSMLQDFEWYKAKYSRMCSSLSFWKNRRLPNEVNQCKNSEDSGDWKVVLEVNHVLKERAIEDLAIYLTKNIVEPFNQFFVDSLVYKEREKSEELALQCKLVVDRKIGSYLGVDSILGWPLEKVKSILFEHLNILDEKYQRRGVILRNSVDRIIGANMPTESIDKEFKITLLEMLAENVGSH